MMRQIQSENAMSLLTMFRMDTYMLVLYRDHKLYHKFNKAMFRLNMKASQFGRKYKLLKEGEY